MILADVCLGTASLSSPTGEVVVPTLCPPSHFPALFLSLEGSSLIQDPKCLKLRLQGAGLPGRANQNPSFCWGTGEGLPLYTVEVQRWHSGVAFSSHGNKLSEAGQDDLTRQREAEKKAERAGRECPHFLCAWIKPCLQ